MFQQVHLFEFRASIWQSTQKVHQEKLGTCISMWDWVSIFSRTRRSCRVWRITFVTYVKIFGPTEEEVHVVLYIALHLRRTLYSNVLHVVTTRCTLYLELLSLLLWAPSLFSLVSERLREVSFLKWEEQKKIVLFILSFLRIFINFTIFTNQPIWWLLEEMILRLIDHKNNELQFMSNRMIY